MQVQQMIKPGWIIPVIPENTILDNHAIVIDQNKIIAVLPTKEAEAQFEADVTHELPKHVITPGFVNAHTHVPMTLLRGVADDLPLMVWLTEHMWPLEAEIINAESIKRGAEFAMKEMLYSGTTTFLDYYFYPNEVGEVAIKYGVRAGLGCMVMNFANQWARDEAEYWYKVEDTLANQLNHPLVSYCLAPHSPYGVSDEYFKKVNELSQARNMKIELHLHESHDEISQSLKQYGKRPIARLDELGIINDRLIAVHMVQVNAAEIDLIAERGVSIAHCPESNMKLANGFAPTAAFSRAGINIAIGTDSAASNNDLNMLSEMRSTAFLAKAVSHDPTAVSAHEALKMATLNGAKAMGLEDKIGSIEPGKCADLIAFDLSMEHCQPLHNPLSYVVYSADRSMIKEVWVNGKHLLTKGKLL